MLCRCLTWEVQGWALSPRRQRCRRFWLILRKVTYPSNLLKLQKPAVPAWWQAPCVCGCVISRCMPMGYIHMQSGPSLQLVLLAHTVFTTARMSGLQPTAGMTAVAGQSPASSALVMIAPIPPSESVDIHLMALTADGRRFYLSTTQPGTSAAAATGRRTPSVLRNVSRSRSAIPAPQHQGQSRCSGTSIITVCCSLMSELPNYDGRAAGMWCMPKP